MSTPEKLAIDVGKIKAWYKQYPFYAGLIVGFIAGQLVLHFLHI
jgi:hypothetical protein